MIETFFIVAIFLLIFMIFGVIRIVLGPTVPDRVVGLDTINTLVIAAMIILGAAYDEVIYTLYIAKYLEGDLE